MTPVIPIVLPAAIGWLSNWPYIILIPIATIEGPLVMVASGILVRLGVYSFLPAYVCLMAGDMIGDIAWYAIGYYWGRPFIKKFGHFFSINDKMVGIVERFFHDWKNTILIGSKITMGFGFAVVTLFTAGLVKIPFRQYFLLNLIGQFFWTALLMGIGFFVANLYTTFSDIFSRAGITAGAIIVLVLLFGFGKYVRMRIVQKYSSPL